MRVPCEKRNTPMRALPPAARYRSLAICGELLAWQGTYEAPSNRCRSSLLAFGSDLLACFIASESSVAPIMVQPNEFLHRELRNPGEASGLSASPRGSVLDRGMMIWR